MKIHPAKNGFTLIELIVVATIAAILMTIGVVSYTSANIRSRDTKRKSDLEQIRTALEMYRADVGSYPLTGNLNILKTKSYMQNIPVDPKDPTYTYNYTCAASADGNCYSYTLSAHLEGGGTCSASPNNYCVYNP